MHGNDGRGRKRRIKHTLHGTATGQRPEDSNYLLFGVAELASGRGDQPPRGAIRLFLPLPSFPCIQFVVHRSLFAAVVSSSSIPHSIVVPP
jgi:hypothetical protein